MSETLFSLIHFLCVSIHRDIKSIIKSALDSDSPWHDSKRHRIALAFATWFPLSFPLFFSIVHLSIHFLFSRVFAWHIHMFSFDGLGWNGLG